MNKKQEKENKIIFLGIGLILLISSFYILDKTPKEEESVQFEKSGNGTLFTDYEYITASELSTKITSKEKITLLDPRDSASFEKNHIENSLNVTEENLDQITAKLDKKISIAVIGYDFNKKKDESALIKKLKELKFENVKALSGGITGWAQEGNQLVSGGDKESALDWSKIDQIIPEQLKLAIDNQYPVFIIDTRESFLYNSGHIPGAVNIPLNKLEERKREIPLSKEVLVYGGNTDDDFKASVQLNDLGFLATFTLKGGFGAWQEKRFELVK